MIECDDNPVELTCDWTIDEEWFGNMLRFEEQEKTTKDLSEYIESRKHILPKGCYVCISKDKQSLIIGKGSASNKEFLNFADKEMNMAGGEPLDGKISDHCGGTYMRIGDD